MGYRQKPFDNLSPGRPPLRRLFFAVRFAFLALVGAFVLIGAASQVGLVAVHQTLNPADMSPDGGKSWVYYNFSQRPDLSGVGLHQDRWTRSGWFFSEGDDNAGDRHGALRSTLRLFEDGKPLGPPHAFNDTIRNVGGGAFSFRTIGLDRALAFSTSDNSDPRSNGREYRIRYPIIMAADVWGEGLGLFGLLILLEWLRSRRQPLRALFTLSRLMVLGGLTVVVITGTASYAGLVVVQQELDPSELGPHGGYGWVYYKTGTLLTRSGMFLSEGDDNTGTRHGALRAAVTVLEDGKPLGPPHAFDDTIHGTGGGAYSYRAFGTERFLVFSASDNSDPRSNGRTYLVRIPITLEPVVFQGAVVLFGVLALWEWQRSRRHFPKLARRVENGLKSVVVARWRVFLVLFLAGSALWMNTQDGLLTALGRSVALADLRPEQGMAYYGRLAGDPVPAPVRGLLCEASIDPKGLLSLSDSVLTWSYAYDVFRHRVPVSDVLSPLAAPRLIRTCSALGGSSLSDIATLGGGRFLIDQGVFFSSLDGTDPTATSRDYSVLLVPDFASGWVAVVTRVLLICGGLGVIISLIFLGLNFRTVYRRSVFLQEAVPGFVVTAVLLIAILVGTEGWLRATLPFKDTASKNRYDAVAGITFEPNSVVQSTNHINYWQESRVNSLGFLDREPVIPKPPGTFRILFIGDSFVEATQVAIEEKSHVVLEHVLRERRPGCAIDTVAMGYSGTGQSNELSFYEAFGKKIHPDLIVLVVINNDFANNSTILESIRNGWDYRYPPRLYFEPEGDHFRRIEPNPQYRLLPLPITGSMDVDYKRRVDYLRNDAGVAKLLEGWAFPDDVDMDRMFYADALPPVFENAVRSTERSFQAFADLGHTDGFKILVVASERLSLDSDKNEHGRLLRADGQMRRLKDITNRVGMPVLDLAPTFEKHRSDPYGRIEFEGHWNPIGHRWVAEAVADYLLGQPGMLPDCAYEGH